MGPARSITTFTAFPRGINGSGFRDTFYWVALLHRKDVSNKAVLEFTRSGARIFITTDEVLTEVLTFCSASEGLRKEAAISVRHLLSAGNVRVIPQSRESFIDGLALYEGRPDKGYSLTDCISMLAMRREGLTDVLTNDRTTGTSSRKASRRFSAYR